MTKTSSTEEGSLEMASSMDDARMTPSGYEAGAAVAFSSLPWERERTTLTRSGRGRNYLVVKAKETLDTPIIMTS